MSGAKTADAEASAATAERVLDVENLSVHFTLHKRALIGSRKAILRAVDRQSFHIARGETLGLVGESGCGKSTTGRAIVRLNRPTPDSKILFHGRDIYGVEGSELRNLRRKIQMIFQDPYSSLNPQMNVADIVAEPMQIHGYGSKRAILNRLAELMETVGLPQAALGRYPHQFSGGQRQRIGIARALALDPELVIADEPVSALDVSIQAQIVNLLRRLRDERGLAYLFISHDLAVVRQISDRVMVMFLGRSVESAPTDVLYGNPLHPYTIALLASVPDLHATQKTGRTPIVLEGEVQSLEGEPKGCRFRQRCWLYNRLKCPGICAEQEPEPVSVGEGHSVACHFTSEVTSTPEQQQFAA